MFVESLGDYIQVKTAAENMVSKEKLSKMAERLPEKFLRIQRSFIINTERVKHFAYNEVLVEDKLLNIDGNIEKKSIKYYRKIDYCLSNIKKVVVINKNLS